MPESLIITSLPRTLDGSQGYGIAAQTRGIDRLLVSKLNALANYDFDKSAEGIEPINFFHVKVDAAQQSYQVLGRISSAPADYTGRAIYIAHFYAFTIRELHQAGPVAVLRHLIDNQRFSDKYQGPPQEWEPIGWNLSGLTDIPQGKCPLWEQTFGNAAMGGIMADRLEKREATGFFYRSEQLSSTLWDHLTEANAVLRPGLSRWNATFATASHGWSGDNAVLWKGTLTHTKGERRLRTDPRFAFVDFSDPSKTNAPLTRGEYSHIAQNGLTLKPSPMALVKPIEKEPEDILGNIPEFFDTIPHSSPSQSPPGPLIHSPNRPPPSYPKGRAKPPPIRRPGEKEDRGWNKSIQKEKKTNEKTNINFFKYITITVIILSIILLLALEVISNLLITGKATKVWNYLLPASITAEKKLQNKADQINLKIGTLGNFNDIFPNDKTTSNWIKLHIAKNSTLNITDVVLNFEFTNNWREVKPSFIPFGNVVEGNFKLIKTIPVTINEDPGELQKLYELYNDIKISYSKTDKKDFKTIEEYISKKENGKLNEMYQILSKSIEFNDKQYTGNLFLKIKQNELVFNDNNFKRALQKDYYKMILTTTKSIAIMKHLIKDINKDAAPESLEETFKILMDAIAKLNPKKGLKK
ncbi:MAG: hypothetical protein EXS11_04240 [Gemmataceae bacterium]|nr:hypothetical protein [Gemmataceae bacterium]